MSDVPDIVAKAKGISEEVRSELCALSVLGRLGKPNQRYWDVAEADSHTFNWTLRDYPAYESSVVTQHDEHRSDGGKIETELSWEVKRRLDYEHTQRSVNAQLNDWLQKGSGLFHIAGKPGSGKSTLMKYLVQHPKVTFLLERWAQPKRLALGKFFFWKPDHGQNTLEALMRGLLYSVIHYDADLVNSAFPGYSIHSFEQLSLQSKLDLTKEDIFEAFDNLVKNSTLSRQFNFCFFIDGLDELDEATDTTYAQVVKLLQQWTDTARGSVKIFVSSRPFPVFEDMPVDHRIQLQNLTKYDIVNFVYHTLQSNRAFRSEMRINPQGCQRLIKAVTDGSDGVFLWVSLVLKSVERGLLNADSIPVLLQRVETTPRELELLFESLLLTIEECHAQMALLLLAVIMEFKRGPQNFQILVHICRQFFRARETSKAYSIDSVFQPDNPREAFDWTREEAKRTKTQLDFRCKGLLEIVAGPSRETCEGYPSGCVTFTHRSIPEFLGRWLPEHMSAKGLGLVHIQNAMCWMLLACIEFDNSTTSLEDLSIRDQSCMRAYIQTMAQAATANILTMDPWETHHLTAFSLLNLSEDALLPAMSRFAMHGNGDDRIPEGLTWNTVRLEGSDDSSFGSWCAIFPSPLVAAAAAGCHAYLRWRLPRMPRSALCGDIIRHCLEAPFGELPHFVRPISAWISDCIQVVEILIRAMGADINGTLLPCCGVLVSSFNQAGALPSVFDAFWINVLLHRSYSIGTFQQDLFFMIELLLRLGATPRSVLCVGAARNWFRIGSQYRGPDAIESGKTSQSLGTGHRGVRDKNAPERLRMICGKNDGVVTLEKWVAYAKPPNMRTLLQLIRRSLCTEAELPCTDVRDLTLTERLHAEAMTQHGVHRDGKLIWIEEFIPE